MPHLEYIYNVQVQVMDSGAESTTQDLTVTVTDQTDASLTLPSGGGSFTVQIVGGNLQVVDATPTTLLDVPLADAASLTVLGMTDPELTVRAGHPCPFARPRVSWGPE